MSTISLAEAALLQAASRIRVSYAVDGDVIEPFFDYDDDGNPTHYDFDVEPSNIPDSVEELSEIYNVALSDFAETVIRLPEAGRVVDFNFEGREYLRRIYDTPAKKTLLKCGRQVEKSMYKDTKVSLFGGFTKMLKDVKIGDDLLGLSDGGEKLQACRVTWRSNIYIKPCIRVTTKSGASVKLAKTHPLRTWGDWSDAGDLSIGDVVALDGRSLNRTTYPTSISKDLLPLADVYGRGGYVRPPDLAHLGLKAAPARRLNRIDLSEYIEYLEGVSSNDERVRGLKVHLHTDLYWDEITDIEDVGDLECCDITTTAESFIGGGFITHNSTTLGNKLLGFSSVITNFRSLFVAPSAEQAKVFSSDRIKDVINASPLLTAYTGKINQAVFFKKFINFSQIRLRYAYLTADRTRGIPADLIELDEIQDILVDNIPVIEESAFHSAYKLFLYSGTPKSMDNTLEHYWQNFSTQNEWVVPCERHGTPKDPSTWHWNILDESNIGRDGLVCDKCGEAIDATHPLATWASIQPVSDDNKDRVTFDGYRIPQIMVQWVDWPGILEAQEQYSRSKFYNEKLGMSYDSGVRPITKAQVKACCKAHLQLSAIESMKSLVKGHEVFAGIDWGSGENTYTVLALGAYLGTGNFSVFYIHRFTGKDVEPERQIDLISQILSQFRFRLSGSDYGGGFHPNAALARRFGPQKIMKYQYNANQKKKIHWENELGRWMVHRTEVMSAIFSALKKRFIDLPNWDEFRDPYGDDILNIFSEYNERTRMTEYKHSPGKTDDSFHAILLCVLASMVLHPRPDILTPMKESGVPEQHGQYI